MPVPCALLLLLLGGLLGGCHRPVGAAHQHTPPAANPTAAASPAARPEMVFLSFKAAAPGPGPATITLLQSTVAAGNPKSNGPDATQELNYMVVRLLGADGQLLGAATTEHPLRHSAETAEADGRLRRQDVQLPEAEFFVRMALPPQARVVRVEEFINHQPVGSTNLVLPERP